MMIWSRAVRKEHAAFYLLALFNQTGSRHDAAKTSPIIYGEILIYIKTTRKNFERLNQEFARLQVNLERMLS